ncbi:MAG: hypothetical protein EU539_05945, partial [Promethearchaeota archaeon]
MNNKKKILILSLLSICLMIISVSIQPNMNPNNTTEYKEIILENPRLIDDDITKIRLKTSGIENPIEINGSATGVDANNWTWAKNQYWCSGNGTWDDPYIIENLNIDGEYTASCISIYDSKNVYFTIRNCTLFNAGKELDGYPAGIYLSNVNNGTIRDNNCSNNVLGIYINNGNNNTILSNILNNNTYAGIELRSNCKNNIISGNIANNNSFFGISLTGSMTKYCEKNTISGNIASNNTKYGINIQSWSIHNTISRNIASENKMDGIRLYLHGDDNTITENTVKNNKEHGIFILSATSGNTIYKNYFIDNQLHASVEESSDVNYWNNSIIGNYWDNYTDEDGIDDYGDGIGDNEYTYIPSDTYPSDPNMGPNDSLPIFGDPFNHGEKIHIDGNLNSGNNSWTWASTRAWCNGSGTAEFPYIIKNLEIDADSSGSGVLIGNSSKYLKIENCLLTNSGSDSMDAGIKLDNVTQAHILDNIITENNNGMILQNNSDDNLISSNSIADNNLVGVNITTSNCEFNQFYNNNFSANGIRQANDNGTYNSWNNTFIGNYWSDYEDKDLDDDFIGDKPYNIFGSAGSKDFLPIWDDGYTPNPPNDPSPSDGASGVILDPELSVVVSDPDGGTLDVEFYNADGDILLGTDSDVLNGTTASFTWSGRAEGITYSWYVVVDDGIATTQSSTWTFTTNHPPNAPSGPESPSHGASGVI